MEKNSLIAFVATVGLFFMFLTVTVVQVQTTTRAKIAAGYTEKYVPYSNIHVWSK